MLFNGSVINTKGSSYQLSALPGHASSTSTPEPAVGGSGKTEWGELLQPKKHISPTTPAESTQFSKHFMGYMSDLSKTDTGWQRFLPSSVIVGKGPLLALTVFML